MAPTANEDQFKFLISCIRHSNNGKVDFEAVAKECEIVTKAAAAKRYERLMKAHGITLGGSGRSNSENPVTPTKKANSETPRKGRATKKRKLDEVKDEDGGEDGGVGEEGAVDAED